MIHFIVNLLTTLYENGETTFVIDDKKKPVDVKVTRKSYPLSKPAKDKFIKIHDDWEINMCKKYHFDTLISGKEWLLLFSYIFNLYQYIS